MPRTSVFQKFCRWLLRLSLALMFLCKIAVAGECKPISQSINRLSYKANDKKGMISDKQWDLAVSLGKEYFSAPYPAGVFEISALNQWKLIDVGSEGLLHAIVAVDESGKTGFIFALATPFTQRLDKEVVDGRITARHLESFNEILAHQNLELSSPVQVLELSLLFVQIATFRFANSHLELIASTKEVLSAYASREPRSSISPRWLGKLNEVLAPPCVSENRKDKTAIFFTLDPKLNLVEGWKVTTKGSKIDGVVRLSFIVLSD